MDTLDFDRLPDEVLPEILRLLGRYDARAHSREAIIRQIKIRILAAPGHFDAFRHSSMGTSTGIPRIMNLVHLLNTVSDYDALGLPVIRRGTVLESSRLRAMMYHPTDFDDTLLTMVPLGTYQASDIFPALVDAGVPNPITGVDAYSGIVSLADQTAYNLVVTPLLDAYFRDEVVIPLVNAGFDYEWVVDVGRSGTRYPRIMVTMPPSADGNPGMVWSTPPFGLRHPHPIPLVAHGVNFEEIGRLSRAGMGLDLSPPDRVADAAILCNHGGAIFERPDPSGLVEWPAVVNLRTMIDTLGIDGIGTLLRTYRDSYRGRPPMPDARAAVLARRHGITAVFEGTFPLIMRIQPSDYATIPPHAIYGLPPPVTDDFIDILDRPRDAVTMSLAQKIAHVWGPVRSPGGTFLSRLRYLGLPVPTRVDTYVIMFAVFENGGLGDTAEFALPHPSTEIPSGSISEPVVMARIFGLTYPELYTPEMLWTVIRRGYRNPPLITPDLEAAAAEFATLTPPQVAMVRMMAQKPDLRMVDFIHDRLYTRPTYALIRTYNPATIDAFIEEMTLLPPPHVRRSEYVEGELPLLIQSADGSFNTDGHLLAAAQCHVPYSAYIDIGPYVDSMREHRFHLPFTRSVDSRGMTVTAMGADIANLAVFMVAYGTMTEKVWFSATDLVTITRRHDGFYDTGYDGVMLTQRDFDNLCALFYEAIDVLYYPAATTVYHRAIYASFTHADENAFDIMIINGARVVRAPEYPWLAHLDALTSPAAVIPWLTGWAGLDIDAIGAALTAIQTLHGDWDLPTIQTVVDRMVV